ncbi:MAG: hypothetical protein COA92_01980 [Sulfurovum sp.]|nr:MAG: hypothetical protein COA92_01980 [Sulfurovum sp.]
MNKIFLHLIIIFIFSVVPQAKMIDGIALIVEGEAVTTAEIRAVQTQLDVSKEQAIDLLIQDRLQKAAMKDIEISEESIDAKITEIAEQNDITIPKMQKILLEQGTKWVKYRKSIKESLKKSKFFQKEVLASIPTPSEDELKLFYNSHKELFTIPTSIAVTEYSSPSKDKIDVFLKTRKAKNVKSRTLIKYTKDLETSILSILMQTQNGNYTRPINAGDRYIVYRVNEKKGETTMPFEMAKGAVGAKWKEQQQSKALKDYFEKLRTRADIQKVR